MADPKNTISNQTNGKNGHAGAKDPGSAFDEVVGPGRRGMISLQPIDHLNIDHDYQRPLNMSWVERVAPKWSDDIAGFIVVNMRKNGSLFVVDGQGRVTAKRLAEPGSTIWCRIFNGLTVQQEADLFLKLNDVQAVTALQRFKARLAAGEPVAVAINQTIESCGLRIDYSFNNDHNNRIMAISAVEQIYQEGGALGLHDSLALLHETWPVEKDAFTQNMMKGAFLFLTRWGREFSRASFLRKVSRVTPHQLQAKALGYASARRYANAPSIAIEMKDLYNRDLRSHRLENDSANFTAKEKQEAWTQS